jgi:tRNA nucleotidyltransferase (CCA-adding enzyme)
MAQNAIYQKERLDGLGIIEMIYSIIQAEEQCISLKKLAVNGEDLLELGIPKGKQVGFILNKLLKLVIDSPELNIKDFLLKEAIKIKKSDLL